MKAAVPAPNVETFKRRAVEGIANAYYSLYRVEPRKAAIRELKGVTDDAQRLLKSLARFKAAAHLDGYMTAAKYAAASFGGTCADRIEAELANILKVDIRSVHRALVEDGNEPVEIVAAFLTPFLSDLAADAKTARGWLRPNRNKHWIAHQLIENLARAAIRTGGKFTFDHQGDKDDQRGSLVDAVALLRKCFPDGFFPKVMTATEQRDLKEAQRRGPPLF